MIPSLPSHIIATTGPDNIYDIKHGKKGLNTKSS